MEYRAWFQCIKGCDVQFELNEVVYECSNCGSIYEVQQKRNDEAVYSCPEDGSSCNLIGEEDIVEELAKVCEMYSSELELISTDSSEGTMLLKAFGGIAAILRYQITF